jgi:serine/threonine protein kinase
MELFQPGARCTTQSDVWALGAVLFALRCQHYPFVDKSEASSRPQEGPDRERFEKDIADRALQQGADGRLAARVREILPTGPQEVMLSMLSFDPKSRPSAREAYQQWDSLLRSWVKPGRAESKDAQAAGQELGAYMRAVLAREVGLSAMQWERVLKGIEDLGGKLSSAEMSELEALRKRIKALRDAGEVQ